VTPFPCFVRHGCTVWQTGGSRRFFLDLQDTLGPSDSILRFVATRVPSHRAKETKSAIYGPCGVMACTLGIFYHLKAYIQGRSSNLRRTVLHFCCRRARRFVSGLILQRALRYKHHLSPGVSFRYFSWSLGVPFVVSERHPDPHSMFLSVICVV
jgi:hypothetical protein